MIRNALPYLLAFPLFVVGIGVGIFLFRRFGQVNITSPRITTAHRRFTLVVLGAEIAFLPLLAAGVIMAKLPLLVLAVYVLWLILSLTWVVIVRPDNSGGPR